MTEIDNDKLLRDFFAENKQEIADNGFSRQSQLLSQLSYYYLWLHERLLLWHKQNKYRLKVQSISFPDFYLYESKNSLSLSFSVKQ